MKLQSILFCLILPVFWSCSKDDSKPSDPSPDADAPQSRNGVDDTSKATGSAQSDKMSPADGCGWAFELERDPAAIKNFTQLLVGEWIDQTHNEYSVKYRAVSGGGRSFADPETKREYVTSPGYSFDLNLNMKRQTYLFDTNVVAFNDPDFPAGFPFSKTIGSDAVKYWLGKPLKANPNFRPIEMQEREGCTTILVSANNVQKINVVFRKSRLGSVNEPSIEDYYSSNGFAMTLGRFNPLDQ